MDTFTSMPFKGKNIILYNNVDFPFKFWQNCNFLSESNIISKKKRKNKNKVYFEMWFKGNRIMMYFLYRNSREFIYLIWECIYIKNFWFSLDIVLENCGLRRKLINKPI